MILVLSDLNFHTYSAVWIAHTLDWGECILLLSENIRLRQAGIQGTVYVRFVVDKDGNATEHQVRRGISPECDEEALRAVKTLPRFNPGTQRGRPVKVYYTVPVKFSL